MRARVVTSIACVGLLLGARAACDPIPAPPNAPIVWYHVASAGHLVTDGGTDLRLPPGYYLPDRAWTVLDVEIRRLQDAETRLTAENGSLRTSAGSWRPGWKTIALAFAAGAAAAVYVESRIR